MLYYSTKRSSDDGKSITWVRDALKHDYLVAAAMMKKCNRPKYFVIAIRYVRLRYVTLR